ncbi:RNA-directed DNA polymerase, eukaryota [Tanacetum coccineum]
MKELFNICGEYGSVTDVFIAYKLYKLGKRFAFISYLKVKDVEGLSNTWIGNYKLYANIARFDRKELPSVSDPAKPHYRLMGRNNVQHNAHMSYANIVQGKHVEVRNDKSNNDSTIMLKEDYLRSLDALLTVFTCVKEFRALTNMISICHNEGFPNINLCYLGGFWILVEFSSIDTCEKFYKHEDVEGVPAQAWTDQTFSKIAAKWGDLIYTVDLNGTNKYSVCLCIKTSLESLINESLKLNVRGRMVTIGAKEIIGWIIKFLEEPSNLETEQKEGMEIPTDSNSNIEENNWDENDEEKVEDTYCNMHNAVDDIKDVSSDPFGFDELIKRTTKGNKLVEENEPDYPLGFTPKGNCRNIIYEKQNSLKMGREEQIICVHIIFNVIGPLAQAYSLKYYVVSYI